MLEIPYFRTEVNVLLTNYVLAKKVYEGLMTDQQVVDAAEAFFMKVLLPDTDFLQHVMARPANVRALIVMEEIVPTFCA